jgi:AbrB family looped-hinge helix DNA binding protein
MPTATLTSKGQVTVPKAIRERLGLQTGEILEFTVDETGRIVVRPQRCSSGICGILRDFRQDEPVSVEEMNRAIRRRAAGQHGEGSR